MVVLTSAILIISCKKAATVSEEQQIPQSVLSQIAALGFSTNNVIPEEGGYIVEGDIFLDAATLSSKPSSPRLVIATEEQYNTFNLVTGLPRNITVSTSGSVNAAVSAAVDGAIARYNAQGLRLTFTRVTSGGDINVKIVRNAQYIASAGFPTGGNPYNTINFNKRYETYSSGFLTTVLAHEMGHCIGFRHTDYMNRSYSCGSGGNEGQETSGVGAVHIPGTPTGPDPNSWMLACLSATTNRPFNGNDITALNYLY
jgi:hypothetical protein